MTRTSIISMALALGLAASPALAGEAKRSTFGTMPDGRPVAAGAQTVIGGNDRYVALCRRHFTAALELDAAGRA